METITQEVTVWIPTYCNWIGPDDFAKPDFDVTQLFFCREDSDYPKNEGYTYVGKATITMAIPERQALIDGKVAALREELKSVRANSQRKINAIEDKIAKLLAITYEPKAEDDHAI